MASGSLKLVRHKILHNYSRSIINFNHEYKCFSAVQKSVNPNLLYRSNSIIASNINILGNLKINDNTNSNSMNMKRSNMFVEEQKRQKDLIPRVEKIQVQYEGAPDNMKLLLNKSISTPLDVALHISEDLVERSALAMVNGELWDMGRPLEDDCTIELMHFYIDEPYNLNRAFWRSCSFLLGAALETVFKKEANVVLHSFPAPNVASGSFIYDVELSMSEWSPTKEELMAISAAMHRLSEKQLPFERLVVDASLATEMFANNKFKVAQIPDIAAKSKSGHSVTLYKVGNHVDISSGPMIGDTSFLGRRCTIAGVHKIENQSVPLYRFQGVALPKGVFLGHFPFSILEKRASKLNETNLSSAKHVNPA